MNNPICILCEKEIPTIECGDPFLSFRNKSICTNCSINIIEPIYKLPGCGGIQHVIFDILVHSTFNRKIRIQIRNYKRVFNKLLHKYKFECVLCGSKKNLTIDHIKPVSKGGGDEINNLQILCKSCNSRKSNK